jgi:hypothetical protein
MLTVGVGMRLQQKHQFRKQRRKNAELYRRYSRTWTSGWGL